MITKEQIKELFDYREDGNLVRKKRISGLKNKAGAVVGSLAKDDKRPEKKGYMVTKIQGKHYSVHKLIWLWHYGVWPDQLDHINRNSLDNRIENLRLSTPSENMMNRKKFANNTSGVTGVSWHKNSNRWFVYVYANKKRKNIGYFEDLELAELVAIEARDLYHGNFARLA